MPITLDSQPGDRVVILFCKLGRVSSVLTQMEGHPKYAQDWTAGISANRATFLLKERALKLLSCLF